MLDMLEQVTAQKLDSQSTALYGSASLWDDGLIDPRDTRTLLGYLLDICHEAEVRPLQSNSFGVARFLIVPTLCVGMQPGTLRVPRADAARP